MNESSCMFEVINKTVKNGNNHNLLQREFESYGPRMVLLTDITYLPYNGTFAYLSAILDVFTKQVLAYVVSGSMEVDFVLEIVNILIRDHGVSLNQETILHSDQGCHYTSYRFIDILHDKKLRQSMSRKGNCWDNAPQESCSAALLSIGTSPSSRNTFRYFSWLRQ